MESSFLTFLASSGAVGLLSAWLLQLAKQSNIGLFSWFGTEANKAKANFAASAFLAGLGTIGVHTNFGMDAKGFHMQMDGTWHELIHSLGQYLWQLLNNHGMYKLFIVPPEIQGETRELQRQTLELVRQFIKREEDKVKLFVIALALATMTACASMNVQAEKVVHQSIVQSENLHTSHVLTDEQFKAVNLELNRVAVAGREYTKLQIAHQATPNDALTLLSAVDQVIHNLSAAPYVGSLGSVLDKLAKLGSQLRSHAK